MSVKQDSTNQNAQHMYSESKARLLKYPRLPCRGCLTSCKNYDRCDGKPWRMAE